MIIGFTGTSKGMTLIQEITVKALFRKLDARVLHHGDCVGADAQAHTIARELSIGVVLHPPSDMKKRAFCIGSAEYRLPKPYLVRNHAIVNESQGLVAAPRGVTEQFRGSGTWATIRYARKARRHIWIIYHDGTVGEEGLCG